MQWEVFLSVLEVTVADLLQGGFLVETARPFSRVDEPVLEEMVSAHKAAQNGNIIVAKVCGERSFDLLNADEVLRLGDPASNECLDL